MAGGPFLCATRSHPRQTVSESALRTLVGRSVSPIRTEIPHSRPVSTGLAQRMGRGIVTPKSRFCQCRRVSPACECGMTSRTSRTPSCSTMRALGFFVGIPWIRLLPSLVGWGLKGIAGDFGSTPHLAHGLLAVGPRRRPPEPGGSGRHQGRQWGGRTARARQKVVKICGN